MTRRGCGGSALCALREEGYGMAQGMNKLNEALASLPEVRELLLRLTRARRPSPCRAFRVCTARSSPLPCGTRHSARF